MLQGQSGIAGTAATLHLRSVVTLADPSALAHESTLVCGRTHRHLRRTPMATHGHQVTYRTIEFWDNTGLGESSAF